MSNLESYFDNSNDQDWLNALPTYQKNLVSELLDIQSHDEAATIWLEATVGNNSPFSAEPQPKKKYFELIKKEIHKLLCGNPDYVNERNELNQLIHSPENKGAFIALVSASIGAKVGLAATFIAPAIVIIFMTIGRIALNAWCQLETEQISQ
jgi:hypothetical protein